MLSEQIVTSELLLRQCLSVLVKEMTFDWPQPSPQSVLSPALQWFSFAVPAPHPQYPSIQQREKTFFLALNPFTIPSSSLNVRLLVCLLRWCWLQWVIVTTCYEMRWPLSSNNCLCLAPAPAHWAQWWQCVLSVRARLSHSQPEPASTPGPDTAGTGLPGNPPAMASSGHLSLSSRCPPHPNTNTPRNHQELFILNRLNLSWIGFRGGTVSQFKG